ncbi:unnamed protein product [Menidia menidia]|uniref:(Atlantic silverside) hypothetical protein n=1 Tax=Menidia menidia TaxID=238744 RepID=A0A8S4ATI5_9TELE|nr:unnamed protein product [Menidia menidia]
MAAAVLLLMVSLLHLLAAQGPGVLFIKSGSDLLLDANTTLRISENAFLVWKFKEIQNIVRFMFGSQNATLHQSWRDRARLFKTNYSLLLNKVTVSDSGSYGALFSGDDDKYVAKYKVQVQDPVSPVHLTVSSSSSSSLSCNLTVTCSTGNSNIHAAIQCHNQTCSLENSTMHSPHLYIYLESDHIICNHSNQVSRETNKTEIKSYCSTKPVSRAVYLQTGDSVFLNVTETDVPANFFILSWKFSGLNDLMITFSPHEKPHVHPNYSSRMDYDVKKYFVKLRNLQKADSGVYTAQATTFQVKTVAEYNVTVQDPVSPVKMAVNQREFSSVSLSCNLTVTCSTEDAHISSTFTCDNKTCRLEGGERSQITKSAASLQVQLSGQSIICNHSNQISWTKDVIKIQDHCIQYGETERYSSNYLVRSHYQTLSIHLKN